MILYPEIVVFYQKWRGKNSWLRSVFIEAEMNFQKKIKLRYPEMSDEKIVMTHAFFHGVITAPFMSSEQVLWATQEFQKIFLLGLK